MKFGALPEQKMLVVPKERLQEVVEQEYLLAKKAFEGLPNADLYEAVVLCISHGSKKVAQIKESVDYLVVIFHDDTIVVASKNMFEFQIKRKKKISKSRELFIPQLLPVQRQ